MPVSSSGISSLLDCSSRKHAPEQLQQEMKVHSYSTKCVKGFVAACALGASLTVAHPQAAVAGAPGPGEMVFNLSCAGASFNAIESFMVIVKLACYS
jgi:hypothetical protein